MLTVRGDTLPAASAARAKLAAAPAAGARPPPGPRAGPGGQPAAVASRPPQGVSSRRGSAGMLHIVPKKSRPGARVRHALRPSETTVSRGSVCPLPWPPGPQCWRDAGVGVTHPARAAGRRLLPPSAVVAGWGIPGQQAASARALFPRRQHLRAVSGGSCLPCPRLRLAPRPEHGTQ